MANITKNLFDLTSEEEQISRQFYGKIIKCLIAPYHHIKNIPLEPNNEVFVFPERDLTIQQRREIVSVMANSAAPEIRFVTSDVFIITDMVQSCTRTLTPNGEIEKTSTATFCANAHDILFSVLQDKRHVNAYQDNKNKNRDVINGVIRAIEAKSMTHNEYEANMKIINAIGEPIIGDRLKDMIREVTIV